MNPPIHSTSHFNTPVLHDSIISVQASPGESCLVQANQAIPPPLVKRSVKCLAIFDHAFLPPTGTLLSLRSLFNLGVSSPFSNSAISASLASVSKAAAHDL